PVDPSWVVQISYRPGRDVGLRSAEARPYGRSMLPATTPIPDHHRRVHDLVAVFRLFSAPAVQLPAALQRAAADRPVLPLEGVARLELASGFSAVPGARGRWQARARLHGRGLRLVPYTRVDIEIT